MNKTALQHAVEWRMEKQAGRVSDFAGMMNPLNMAGGNAIGYQMALRSPDASNEELKDRGEGVFGPLLAPGKASYNIGKLMRRYESDYGKRNKGESSAQKHEILAPMVNTAIGVGGGVGLGALAGGALGDVEAGAQIGGLTGAAGTALWPLLSAAITKTKDDKEMDAMEKHKLAAYLVPGMSQYMSLKRLGHADKKYYKE
jgi:hypothetical protein